MRILKMPSNWRHFLLSIFLHLHSMMVCVFKINLIKNYFDRLQKKYKQSILVIVNFLKLGSDSLLKGLGPLWTNFPPW
jgi:hypothetical protein